MTGYDPNGFIHEWGCHESRSGLCRMAVYQDKLQSKISTCKNYRQKIQIEKGNEKGTAENKTFGGRNAQETCKVDV